MSLNLNRLNPGQREAVLHGEGPLLILAGAGSGKTSTMSYRIAHLIAERKVAPSAILGLSFTNKAAGELKERVQGLVSQILGKQATRGLTISTFHSLCVKILRVYAPVLGFQTDFSIVDTNDQRDILKGIFKNVKIDDRKFDIDSILFQIGQAKNRFLGPAEAQAYLLDESRMPTDYAIAAATAYEHYQAQLKALNAMDFDDLLFHATHLLDTCAEARDFYNRKFRYILVDEYQDTNASQFKLIRALTEHSQNICVVGDDDQSIYAWRGADPSHILRFDKQFAGVKTITLDQNYRSTKTILDAANAVIVKNTVRHPKKLWSDRGTGEPITEIIVELDRDEGEFVAEEIIRRVKDQSRSWKDFAILYRGNAQSRIFEETLRRHQIPYKIVGTLSFLDRKEVKDILSYWRLLVNPKDDASLRRILNWPTRGIGKSTLVALGNAAFEKTLPILDTLAFASEIAPRAANTLGNFSAMIRTFREELDQMPPIPLEVSAWARRFFTTIDAKRGLTEDNEDPAAAERKWENVEELAHSLGQWRVDDLPEGANGASLIRDFLSKMALDAQDEQEDQDKEKDNDSNQVTLLTLHGSKGLEYPVVFLVGCEEGFLPHKRTLEAAGDLSEERRLAYVGITRARDHLILTRAKNRVRFGKPVPRVRSRFMDEIPRELVVMRDESYPDPQTEEAREVHETKVMDFLAGLKNRLTSPGGPKQ